jgi:hypothetical protein
MDRGEEARYGPPDRSAAHRRPLSRGSNPCGYPHKPLVSYRINRQLSGWIPPPLMIRAFGAHCHNLTHAPQQKASLFNNLVGEQLNRVGHLDVECFGGVQIDDELECGRLQNREVGRFLALENPSDVHAD